jgi:hypothetical protein
MGRRTEALGLVAGLALLLSAASLAAQPKGTPSPVVTRLYVQNVNLSPKPHGEPGATGAVTICLNPATSAVAYNFTALTLADKPNKGQIRLGTAGSPVVTFGAPGLIDPNVGEVEWNDSVPATASVVTKLSKSPSGYYVVVTTRAHSSGALTGRLAGW